MDNNLFKCFTCPHRFKMSSCFNPEKCERKTNGVISKTNSVIHTEILIQKGISVKGRKVKQNLPVLTVVDNIPWDVKEKPFTIYG